MKLFFALIQEMSVFLVIGYLFSKSPAFKSLTGETLRLRHKLVLYVTFSIFSVLGTDFGLPVRDAVANTRAIGAVLAGIIGGPLLGTAVGFTGGLHRYFVGGFVAGPAMLATTVEGLLGGVAHLYLVRTGRSEQIFNPRTAFTVTFCSELTHMAIVAVLGRPSGEALALVRVIALPMITANSFGTFLFMSIIRDQKGMYDKFSVMFSARALKIAERTLGILEGGFNCATATEMARIIQHESGVGAVAITDTEKILAFVGIGSDHHRAGAPIASPETQKAIRNNEVVLIDGVQQRYRCSLSPDCSLTSTLIVPLHVDDEVVGTIKLYEPKHKLFHNMNRTLGEGIANLLSDQLLRSRYEEQKNLLVTSELKLIQAQINPHFLFNALNTIIAITRRDADQARDLLHHLSNFFRINLKRSSELATIGEELDHVCSYLKIEKARFRNKLRTEMRIDKELMALKIPAFTLQPIVENAIKHGISKMIGQGLVRVSASRTAGTLSIEIEDNAGAFTESAETNGLGMNIVDKRIKNRCGSQYGLEVSCVPQERTRVAVSLPGQGC
jgi:two-component system LytT family sensor kinase